MTQNEKDILLKDLSSRLPYGVKGLVTFNGNHFMTQHQVEDRTIDGKLYDRFAELQSSWYDNVTIKPYLFPLSSMTPEQKTTHNFLKHSAYANPVKLVDFYNKHHLDCRGLIPMGLANDATGKNIY